MGRRRDGGSQPRSLDEHRLVLPDITKRANHRSTSETKPASDGSSTTGNISERLRATAKLP